MSLRRNLLSLACARIGGQLKVTRTKELMIVGIGTQSIVQSVPLERFAKNPHLKAIVVGSDLDDNSKAIRVNQNLKFKATAPRH